ncbi:MAG TPA: hypothetical protein PLV67_07360, partial [Methanofastidiosum sp.]|nr:hypothetical protein [Methanofastidiosum sp.]
KITEKFRDIYSNLDSFETKVSQDRNKEEKIILNKYKEKIELIEKKLLSGKLEKQESFKEILKLSRIRTELERTNIRTDSEKEVKIILLRIIENIEEKAKSLLIKY